MAARGGRRQLTWGAPVSWREIRALEAARAVAAARTGAVPSRPDWLIRMAEAAHVGNKPSILRGPDTGLPSADGCRRWHAVAPTGMSRRNRRAWGRAAVS